MRIIRLVGGNDRGNRRESQFTYREAGEKIEGGGFNIGLDSKSGSVF